ncbi:MAG TPA: hypothetical protein PKG58_09605, partial [Bacillota bacterium]|nr:hypothetical protein [Bacillota bacterium]
IGTAVALLSKCVIEVERPNKQTINVSEAITNTADNLAGKIKNAADDFRNMTSSEAGHNSAAADASDIFGAVNDNTDNTFKQ